MHPLLDRRDVLGIAHTNISSTLNSNRKALTRLETENIMILDKNRDLAASLVDLTEQIQAQQIAAIKDSDLTDQAEQSKLDHVTAKKLWRTMKSVVAAIIAGSGINWASNSELKRLVLNEEE